MKKQKVGKLIRIDWDPDDNSMNIIIEVIDDTFKSRALHNKDWQDIIQIKGKDVIIDTE